MKKGLYLDDYRTPMSNPEIEWHIVRSYKEFVNWIEEHGIPDIISFDHDLCTEHIQAFLSKAGENLATVVYDYDSYGEKTGYDCAKWLCNYCVDNDKRLPPIITVHSANYPGAANIITYISNYKRLRIESCKIYRSVW